MLTPESAKTDDAPRRAAELLAPVLGQDRDAIEAKLTANPKSQYVVLARQQTPQVWNRIKNLKSEQDKRQSAGGGTNVLAGINREAHSKRVYPNKGLAAGILGFVGADGKGAAGVEQQADKQLAGKDGKRVYAQSGGRQVPTADAREQAAVAGTDIQLTLDRDIQWAAQKAITEQVHASKADRVTSSSRTPAPARSWRWPTPRASTRTTSPTPTPTPSATRPSPTRTSPAASAR
ncbi:hypothetical protein NKH77_14145 [Streptomyces sp. M19]